MTIENFLSAFYRPEEDVFFRLLDDPKIIPEDVKWKQKYKSPMSDVPAMLQFLSQKNAERMGVFFVVNGGGHSDQEVTEAKAYFVDLDYQDKQAMWSSLSSFSLPPSIVVETKKGYHAYWLTTGESIQGFREAQELLIAHFKGDPPCKNPSRVMRLPGFYHHKGEPFAIQCVWWRPELRYSKDALVTALRASGTESPPREPIPDFCAEGSRNTVLFRKACALQARGLSDVEMLPELLQENEATCIPPLEHDEVALIARQAMHYPKGEVVNPIGTQSPSALTQTLPPYIIAKTNKDGVVTKVEVQPQLLAEHIRQHSYYFRARDASTSNTQTFWYANGVYSQVDEAMIKGYIKSFIHAYDKCLANSRVINEVFFDLQTDLNLVDLSDVNTEEFLINFRNGILDIRTLELHPHSPKMLTTTQIPCNWNPDARCPNFDRFISHLSTNDIGVERLLLQIFGVAISNIHAYQMKKAVFLIGRGDTGKSVLRNLVVDFVGRNNTSNLSLKKLEERFGMATLYNKRIGGTADMAYATVNELDCFKQLTGGDIVSGEEKGKSPFNFVFKGLLWFNGNRIPKFGGDRGDWVYERMIIVPCNNQVETKDTELYKKLISEREGIAVRAVEGAREVFFNEYKYDEPPIVLEERRKAAFGNSSVAQFVGECMEPIEGRTAGAVVSRQQVFNAYRAWCRDNVGNGYCESRPSFYAEAEEKGAGKEVRVDTVRCFSIMTLNDETREYYGLF